MPAKVTTPPTAEQAARNTAKMAEQKEHIDQAIDTLVELADYIDSDATGWNYAALRNVVRRWDTLEPTDPFWYALSELASDDYHSGFDRRLRQATIRLLAVAEQGIGRTLGRGRRGKSPYLTVHTFRELEAAHEAIGVELDRIRREA
jgi:hypothetical protein